MRKLKSRRFSVEVNDGIERGALVLVARNDGEPNRYPSIEDVGIVVGLDKTPDPATTVRRSGYYLVRTSKGDISCDQDDLYAFMVACELSEIPANCAGVEEFLKKKLAYQYDNRDSSRKII